MLTGRVDGAGPDLIKSNHMFLAVLLFLAVLAFWVVQWQGSDRVQKGGAVSWLHPSPGKSPPNIDEN
jgi:hypothetical protein